MLAAALGACCCALAPAPLNAQPQQDSLAAEPVADKRQPLSPDQKWQVPAADPAWVTFDGIPLAERLVIELLRQAGAKRDYTWDAPQPLSSSSTLAPVRSYRGVSGEYYLVSDSGRLYSSDSGEVRDVGPFSPDAIAYFEANAAPDFIVTFDPESLGVFVAMRSARAPIDNDAQDGSESPETLRIRVASGKKTEGYVLTVQKTEASSAPSPTQSAAPATSTAAVTETATAVGTATPKAASTSSTPPAASTLEAAENPPNQVPNSNPAEPPAAVPAAATIPPSGKPTEAPAPAVTASQPYTPEPSDTAKAPPSSSPTTSTAVCGDRKVDPPDEECDDGPTCLNGDPCDPSAPGSCGVILGDNQRCRVRSGDGCSVSCLIEKCGNGRIDAREECDDGNTVSGDHCSASCLIQFCGNGRTDEGEECDPGGTCAEIDDDKPCPLDGVCPPPAAVCLPSFHPTCSTSCRKERRCGDGFTEEDMGEECDDGNQRDGDGCDRDCRREDCGNGIVQSGEQCDDGNKIAADGCDEYCHWTCGNGRIETGEQCDPGSVCSNGKSCSGSEKTCPGECHRRDSPDCDDKCLGRCGNGVKDPGEECDPGRRCSFSGADCTAPGSLCPSTQDRCEARSAQGCTSSCKKKRCGNLSLEPLGADEAPGRAGVDDNGDGTVDDPKEIGYPGTDDEECDSSSADCNPATCKRVRCGDGVVNSPSEQCDSLLRCTRDGRLCRSPDDCPGFLNFCDSGARPRCLKSGRLCLDPGSGECGPDDECAMPPGWSPQNSCDTQCRATCGNGRWDPGEDKKCDLGSHCIKVKKGPHRESLADCTKTGTCPAGERCVTRAAPRCAYCQKRGR